MPTGQTSKWHLDRTVNVAVLIALFAYFVGGVLWYSQTNSRLSILELNQLKDESQERRLIQLETKFDYIKEILGSIQSKLDNSKIALDKKESNVVVK